MQRILFVCLGNICRSPMAEAIFKHNIKVKKLDHLFDADSAGTHGYHTGSQPDHRTVKVCRDRGITIQHAARIFSADDFHRFDHVIAMDPSNYENLRKLQPANAKGKLSLMRSRDLQRGHANDIPDPYYGDLKDFEEVYELLTKCIHELTAELMNQHS